MTARLIAAFLLAAILGLGLARGGAAQNAPLGALGDQNNGKPVNIEAEQGIEWQQDNHVYIARGNVKAMRGDSTVFADTLYAYYRPVAAAKPANAAAAQPAAQGSAAGGAGDPFATGSTEIYRLEADGNVRFVTPTQTAYGDHAIYDVDKTILVMTGKALKIVTPRDVVTAKSSLEWYDDKQIGIARGDALAVREEKRIRGDVLTAQMEKAANQPAHISQIDADGNVVITSQDQIARGDASVYNVDTGIATISGNVKLTRGDNELQGQYAVVDLNRNISRLLSAPPSAQLTAGNKPPRVEGLLIPRSRPTAAQQPGAVQQPGAAK